jgi:hypothetical protein
MIRRLAALTAVLAALSPGVAGALVTIEGFYGLARPPAADFGAAVDSADRSRDLADSSHQIVGGDVLVNLGAFQFGGVVDRTIGDVGEVTALGGLLGFRFGDKLRLDLLGEVGGQRIGDVFEDTDLVTRSTEDQWLLYVGLRPGFAYRFGSGGSGILLGIWGFVRWDVEDERLPVRRTVGDPGSPENVDLGRTTIGAAVRLGFEL